MPEPARRTSVGREEAYARARAVIDQWPDLADLDRYTKGGIASMMVSALLDGAVEGFDWEAQSRFDQVAAEAQRSAHHNAPWSEPTEHTPFTVNARHLAGDVIRAALKAGLVTASDRALSHIALSGSAGHDDTATSLRAAQDEAL